MNLYYELHIWCFWNIILSFYNRNQQSPLLLSLPAEWRINHKTMEKEKTLQPHLITCDSASIVAQSHTSPFILSNQKDAVSGTNIASQRLVIQRAHDKHAPQRVACLPVWSYRKMVICKTVQWKERELVILPLWFLYNLK